MSGTHTNNRTTRSTSSSQRYDSTKTEHHNDTYHEIPFHTNHVANDDSKVIRLVEKYIAQMISMATKIDLSPGEDFEMEARLGKFDKVAGKFRPGVTKEFMDNCISVFNKWKGWTDVTPWTQTEDTFYTVHNTQYRTTTDYTTSSPTIRHVIKDRISSADFETSINKDCDNSKRAYKDTEHDTYCENWSNDLLDKFELYDLRICLSKEKTVCSPPVSIVVPDRVRIKIRKSFKYTPFKCGHPFWSFDFTISWNGVDMVDVDRNQSNAENTSYEVELECLNPQFYMNTASVTVAYLIASFIVKIKNDIMRWGTERPVIKRNLQKSSLNEIMSVFSSPLDIMFNIIQTNTYVDV